nr:MAG TPA: ASCH domain protein [Caudoviricetes sp.]
MVRTILDGRKSCTRRIVKPKQFVGLLPDKCKNGIPEEFLKEKKLMFKPYCDMTDAELISAAYKALYQPGDILYVRETWKKAPNGYYYYEDWQKDDIADVTKWKPSIHMPKEAARIWLKVTDVRVERLQEMTDDDAEAEGCFDYTSTALGFPDVWNSTIKKSDLDRYGWNANPWVWVIEFEQCEKPKEEN